MAWPVLPFGFIGGTVQTNYPSIFEIFIVGGAGDGGNKGGGGGGGVVTWFTYSPNIPVTNPISVTTFNITVGGRNAASSFHGLFSASGGSDGGNAGGASGRGYGGGASGSSSVTNAISGGGGGGYAANGGSGTSASTFGGSPCQPNNSITCGNGAGGYTLDATLQSLLGVTTVGSGGAGGTPGTVQVNSGSCTIYIGGQPFTQTRTFYTGVNAASPGTGAGGSGQGASMYGCGGGGGGGVGRGGFVVVRYPGNVTIGIGGGTGGSKSYRAADNKTYHVFTSSGSLTF
jgi:hypothetical protein